MESYSATFSTNPSERDDGLHSQIVRRAESREVQSRERSRCVGEAVRFDAESLMHAHIQIAKWRRVVRGEGQMLSMTATATDSATVICLLIAPTTTATSFHVG